MLLRWAPIQCTMGWKKFWWSILPGGILGSSWGLPGVFLGLPGVFLGSSWGLPGVFLGDYPRFLFQKCFHCSVPNLITDVAVAMHPTCSSCFVINSYLAFTKDSILYFCLSTDAQNAQQLDYSSAFNLFILPNEKSLSEIYLRKACPRSIIDIPSALNSKTPIPTFGWKSIKKTFIRLSHKIWSV